MYVYMLVYECVVVSCVRPLCALPLTSGRAAAYRLCHARSGSVSLVPEPVIPCHHCFMQVMTRCCRILVPIDNPVWATGYSNNPYIICTIDNWCSSWLWPWAANVHRTRCTDLVITLLGMPLSMRKEWANNNVVVGCIYGRQYIMPAYNHHNVYMLCI